MNHGKISNNICLCFQDLEKRLHESELQLDYLIQKGEEMVAMEPRMNLPPELATLQEVWLGVQQEVGNINNLCIMLW